MRLVDPLYPSKEYSVEKSKFIIGSLLSADIVLEGLKETHVYINREGKNFFIYNDARDPFVSVNGLPFWKKKLKAGDRIEVGGKIFQVKTANENAPITQSLFKPDEELKKAPEPVFQPPSLNPPLQPASSLFTSPQTSPPLASPQLPAPTVSFNFSRNKALETAPQENILTESNPEPDETLEKETQKPTSTKTPFTAFQELSSTYEAEGENETSKAPDRKPGEEEETVVPGQLPPLPNNLLGRRTFPKKEIKRPKTFSGTIFKALPKIAACLLLTGAFSVGSYFFVKNKSRQQELLASEGVTDIAMALAFAKVKENHLEQKSFTDPKFLRHNLSLLLDDSNPALTNLDEQGKFVGSSYFLRIYATAGLNRFLVIAQPQAGFGEWFISRSAFVIYSGDMSLRKIHDIKALNRFLVQTESLDDSSALELAKFIQQNEPVSLEVLAKELDEPTLAPPKALRLLRPGAEERVYNAPRYHHVGENLLKMAEGLEERVFTKEDLDQLREEAKAFSSFKDFVLYSSKGLHRAFAAEKAFASYLSEMPFLVGYLKFYPDGTLLESHLLADADFNRESEDNTRASRENVRARALLSLKEEREQEISLAEQNISSFLREAKNSPFFTNYDLLTKAVEQYTHALVNENEKFRNNLAALFSQQKEQIDFLQEVAAIHGDCAVDCLKAGSLAGNAFSNFSDKKEEAPETGLDKPQEKENEDAPLIGPVALEDSPELFQEILTLADDFPSRNSLDEEDLLLAQVEDRPLYSPVDPEDRTDNPSEDLPKIYEEDSFSETPYPENTPETKERLLQEIKEKKGWQDLLVATRGRASEKEIRSALKHRLNDLFYTSWNDLPEDAFTEENERYFVDLLEEMNLSIFDKNFYLSEFATRKQAAKI